MKPILALLLLLCGPQSDSFTTVVEKNFAAWDRDEDGKLSVEETDRLVLDPAIKGEPAVAIGVIKAVQRGGKWELPDLTVAYFKSCTDGEKTHPDFEKMYAAATRKLGKTSRELFGDGAPSIDSFHQGNIRDCYFLAPVGAAVARDAEA
ncbi:MAG: hypothetical protein HYY17_07790, partial [Planctomycetes bacterium]|nr:hypothetical protein [Planctomycetota bacterium]